MVELTIKTPNYQLGVFIVNSNLCKLGYEEKNPGARNMPNIWFENDDNSTGLHEMKQCRFNQKKSYGTIKENTLNSFIPFDFQLVIKALTNVLSESNQ